MNPTICDPRAVVSASADRPPDPTIMVVIAVENSSMPVNAVYSLDCCRKSMVNDFKGRECGSKLGVTDIY